MSTPLDLHAVRELAYRLWEARGRQQGHAIEDWLDAERQVKAAQNPTPASDVKPKRSRKRKPAPASKKPTVPVDEATSNSPETPKVGSRDAPGG